MSSHLSVEAEVLISYLASHGMSGPDCFPEEVVNEAAACGFVQRVTIGCDEPTLYLTDAGCDHAIVGDQAMPIWKAHH